MNDRELLQQARRCIDPGAMSSPEHISLCKCTLEQIDTRLSQPEARAALAAPEWVRVSDALPVISDSEFIAYVWVVVNGVVAQDAYAPQPENTPEGYCTLSAEPDFCAQGVTHWRYVEPTPKPPEVSK